MEALLKDNILTFEPFIDPNAPPPPPPPPPTTATATASSASTSTSSSGANAATVDDSTTSTADGGDSKTVTENKGKDDVVKDEGVTDLVTVQRDSSGDLNAATLNDNKSNPIQSAEPELEILSFEEFCDALNCSDSDSTSDPRTVQHMWCVEEDETLALLVNSLSDKLGLDPLMVSSSILEGHRVSRGLLPHRTANQIQARYAALCVLNKVMIKLFIYFISLPFAD